MLELSDVTLVVVETRAHELAVEAIKDCVAEIEFADVQVYTDKPDKFRYLDEVRTFEVPDWQTKEEVVRFDYFEAHKNVETSHLLFLEWDAGIMDVTMWRPDFLEYDYIGAPWGYDDGMDVGNGGFCLRSKRLGEELSRNADLYPFVHSAGDGLVCRDYRRQLEAAGMKWAPTTMAMDFAFECLRPSPTSKHFGYHALRNWPYVFEMPKLLKRLHMAEANPYVAASGMLDQLRRGEGPRYLRSA